MGCVTSRAVASGNAETPSFKDLQCIADLQHSFLCVPLVPLVPLVLPVSGESVVVLIVIRSRTMPRELVDVARAL